MRFAVGVLAGLVAVGACAADGGVEPLPDGASADVSAAIDDVAAYIGESTNPIDPAAIDRLATHDDRRLDWVVVDLLQFVGRGPAADSLLDVARRRSGLDLTPRTAFKALGDHLLAADVPAPPGYREWKRRLLTTVDVTWEHFFADPDAELDWRHVNFGGVRADRRAFASDDGCGCIPALDEPPSVPAAEGDWYPDHRAVFGLVVEGEARAYPRNVMEVHELANDRIGGRAVAVVYCTLCRAATAYFVDDQPALEQRPVLRTSGLLNRSNKLAFDLHTFSAFDQFSGRALTGPLRQLGVRLTPIPVVTSTWAEWKRDHPETTLMAGDDGAGPDYPLEPLGDRDAAGPIFPVGAVAEPLLTMQPVFGVVAADGSAVAFPVDDVRTVLAAGGVVNAAGITLGLDGTAIHAVDSTGAGVVGVQAAWFAWSRFHPDTAVWMPAA